MIMTNENFQIQKETLKLRQKKTKCNLVYVRIGIFALTMFTLSHSEKENNLISHKDHISTILQNLHCQAYTAK